MECLVPVSSYLALMAEQCRDIIVCRALEGGLASDTATERSERLKQGHVRNNFVEFDSSE